MDKLLLLGSVSVLVARTVDFAPWTTSHRLKVVPRVENVPGCVIAEKGAFADAKRIFDELVWYAAENNRISGDGNKATDTPEKPFQPKGL